MKKQITTTALLLGALSVVPAVGFAATQRASSTAVPATHASKPATAAHAMRGVVKSIDEKTLVVTRTGGKHAEMTFALNASTQRAGDIATGTTVSIRYREEGKTNVATAISVESAKEAAAHTKPPKR